MARRSADHWRPDEPVRRGPLGLWASALFNICVFVLPLAGAYAAMIVERDRLYTYAPTEGAARASRQELGRLAAALPGAPDRRERWDDYVASALMEGDLQAARGFVLSARAMLPGSAAGGIAGSGDAEVESAALALLTPGTRARYESHVPLLARRATSETTRVAPRPFIMTGDAADFEAAALRDLEDPDSDHLAFVLMGLGVVIAAQNPPDALAGASILQAGLSSSGALPIELRTALGAYAEEALPRTRYRNEVARRAIAGAPAEERGSMLQDAFRAGLNPQALATFQALLAEIGAIGDAATPQGALTLLRHARSVEDLRRVRLLAETNAERAIAIARYAPPEMDLARAGRGQLRFTNEFAAPLAVTVLCFVLMCFAAIMVTAQAVGRALEGVNIIQRVRPSAPQRSPRLVRAFDR